MNYFRITAYNRDEDYSIIIDSYGAFNELWQFSSCLVDKGFSIIAIGNLQKSAVLKMTSSNNSLFSYKNIAKPHFVYRFVYLIREK